jgi:NAD(P)-dependent dehydrogenase (short-subunit alcohol dehydrogenase family)
VTWTSRWWTKETVAVVTGGNKGIGYVIVRELAKNGLTVVLTARDSGRGIAALETLKGEGLKNVCFHPLEVSSSTSAEKLAAWLKDEFGGIDILVSVSRPLKTVIELHL